MPSRLLYGMFLCSPFYGEGSFLHDICLGFVDGLAIASIFGMLYHTLDSRKGLVVEVAIPLALCAVLFGLISLDVSKNTQIDLSQCVLIAVVNLFPISIAKTLVKLARKDSLELVDFFRLVTTAAISVTALLHDDLVFDAFTFTIYLLMCCLIFVAAEWAWSTQRKSKPLATIFSLSVICFSVFGVATQSLKWDFFPLLGITLGLILWPVLFRWFTQHSVIWQGLALEMASQRLKYGSASSLARVRMPISLWNFQPGVCYLNHGSFGAEPTTVQISQRRWRNRLHAEPMDTLARRSDPQWFRSRRELAAWLGTAEENIAFCENATAAMNELASWFPLQSSDEVLLNNHEYGAVRRIWQRAADRAGAKLVCVEIPLPLANEAQFLDPILAACTSSTKLVIASHITSPTAIRLPVERLREELAKREIPLCIDGPHALLQDRIHLQRLGCDFYTASCHKWLCAPLGSGFVYVAPKWHSLCQPARLSWGRLNPNQPQSWTDELVWTGSRDYSAYFGISTAIRLFDQLGRERLEARNHALAAYARSRLASLPGAFIVAPDDRSWYGWMIAVGLPAGDHSTLQNRLWDRYRIEVPIMQFGNQWLIRVSCHLYVTTYDIDFLYGSLRKELRF